MVFQRVQDIILSLSKDDIGILAGMCPVSPTPEGGVKGHNIKRTTLPGSPALGGGELRI